MDQNNSVGNRSDKGSDKLMGKNNQHKIVVAHMGARMHYAVPAIFNQCGYLRRFYTDIYSGKFNFIRLAAKQISFTRKFSDRSSNLLSNKLITHFPLFGLNYAHKLRRVKNAEERLSVYAWAGKEFNRKILQHIRWDDIEAIYGYNTASLELFQAAKNRGVKLIYEQTIAPLSVERQLLEAEEKKFPTWLTGSSIEHSSIVSEIISREQSELALADYIVAGSDFVKRSLTSLNEDFGQKCSVIPYGVASANKQSMVNSDPRRRSLRLLVAGTLGLRKGSPYVLEVAKRIKGVAEIRIVGSASMLNKQSLLQLQQHCDYRGMVPRSEMNEHYSWADVFFLPSICEGSATVTYEAMQHGLPLLVTENTGAFITDGEEGFVVKTGDIDTMLDRIYQLRNDDLRIGMGKMVLQNKEKLSIEAYKRRLMKQINVWLNDD
jgi:glycosyltransferase involved in cell wall biosynthesis